MARDHAPGSSIISLASYARQLEAAGTYRVTSGGNRIRAWKPPRGIQQKMAALIFKRDGFKCRMCGRTDGIELDHIKPYREGGLFIEWNLQAACWRCNGAKAAKWEA